MGSCRCGPGRVRRQCRGVGYRNSHCAVNVREEGNNESHTCWLALSRSLESCLEEPGFSKKTRGGQGTVLGRRDSSIDQGSD